MVEIRPYVFETLMYLVGVHAQVSDIAPPLLDRTLNALVESLVEEALRCFKQVKRFGMGGMLRVGFVFSLKKFFTPVGLMLRRLHTCASTGHTGDRVHAPDALTLCHVQHGKDAL